MEEYLKAALELCKGLKKIALKNAGSYEDRRHGSGFSGDVTYEVDVPMEDYVSEFFSERKLPVKVITEDQGFIDYSKGKPKAVYLIDPLDGTRNLRRNLPASCCSIAVYPPKARFVDEAAACVIGRFDADETYTAVRGEGAFLNRKRIKASGKKDLENAVLIFGGHFPSAIQTYSRMMETLSLEKKSHATDVWLKEYGSTALELAFLASGRADMYAEIRASTNLAFTPKTYDMAAGILLCKEAGVKYALGSKRLGEKVLIDPRIPMQYVGAGSEELMEKIRKMM